MEVSKLYNPTCDIPRYHGKSAAAPSYIVRQVQLSVQLGDGPSDFGMTHYYAVSLFLC